MRILCFIHAPDLGGVERSAIRLCTAWSDQGADVVLFIGRDGGGTRAGNARVVLPAASPRRAAAFETVLMIWWLWWAVQVERPDVLFCPGNTYTVVAAVLRLLLGHDCPPIVAKLSNDLVRSDLPSPLRAGYRLWCRLQGRLLDHFVAFTASMQEDCARLLAVEPGRIATIGNPTLDDSDLAALAAAGKSARASRCGGSRRFVAAGRLEAQKNHALLLNAFARGRRADDTLAIFGEGSLRRALTRQIAGLGLEQHVALRGAAPHASAWLADGDVLLLSSDYEGLPAVVTEAMAAGSAVIATDCSASLAVLLGGVGTIVPTRDVDALARAITVADPDATDRRRAAERARLNSTSATAVAYLRTLAQAHRADRDGRRRARPEPSIAGYR